MNIGDTISKAIKEGKWVNISYINKNNENTFFWIAIKNIDFDNRTFYSSIFNYQKSMKTFEALIHFDNIKSAAIIDFTKYEVPEDLIIKIEHNLDKCEWLNYDHFNHNVLNYYLECNVLDSDPFEKEYTFIPGVDLFSLRKNKEYLLNDEQAKILIKDLYHYNINKVQNSYFNLAINILSIDQNKKKYVICYYNLKYNPKIKSIVLDNTIQFNQSFLIDGRKHSLFNYINMNVDDFTKTFKEKYSYYHDLIRENLKEGELINTRPEVMLLQRDIPVDLEETFNVIEEKYKTGKLPIPLKSFFGNITKRNNIRRKEPSLVICDKKININQMRVLYNSIKYPVTYVQGPPGTGKTQTIINVILSAFYNGKKILICSSNNKPIDGIISKLFFVYKGENIKFPYLRLGNFENIKQATKKIRELYIHNSDKLQKEDLLNKIKSNNDDKNLKLIHLLNVQERRVEIENCLESSHRLIHSFKNNDSKIINLVKNRIKELKADLSALPEITNDEIISLFVPLQDNTELSQYLFFKSIQYISKLKKTQYSELIDICSISDDDERAYKFNKWINNDVNMKLLSDVFPIIFSTNISSRRLGTPNYMFDLVIMDEAGQCNIANALLPITKAESLLLVGDTNQLKPVIILDDNINEKLLQKYNVPECYNYKRNSIMSVMVENDNISKYILLRYHYRCGRKIIDFSNQRYYNDSLNLSYITNEGCLELIDIKNTNIKRKNEAYEEASALVSYVKRNQIKDAFIITPFVSQRDLITKLLEVNNIKDVDCGTIHSLQGAQKNTIIFSPAISYKTSKKTFEWIKNNYELINVAVTRAQNKLIIAADTEVINMMSDKKDDLYNLIQYAKNNGRFLVPANESVRIEIGKSNGSAAEDVFFSTVSHFCSCNKNYEAKRNVSMSKLFNDKTNNFLDMEFDLVLYEKSLFSKKPVIAFEINGGEHLGVYSREKNDKLKTEVCKNNGIKLIVIPNSFVKEYEYIADIIISLNNKNISLQQTLFE